MMRGRLILVPALLLQAMCYKPNWKQPRMVLSIWYDPPVPVKTFPQRYKEIADAKFTMVMGGFGAKTRDSVIAQLAACEEVDLGVVVAGAAGISDYGGASNLWGYQLKDEPSAALFPALAKQTAKIMKDEPGKLRYINLLPTCGNKTMNATNYTTYVREFIEQVKPDVLSMDHYPNFAIAHNASGINMDGYRVDLAVMRKYSLEADIPFWNYFGDEHVFGGEPDASEAMLRWQMYTSLAYGAKGLLYFTYWGGILQNVTPVRDSHAKPKLVLNQQYDRAKRINSHILAYEKHLMQATSEAVWYVPTGGVPTPVSTDDTSGHCGLAYTGPLTDAIVPATNVTALVTAISNQAGVGPALPFLIGQFKLEDGRSMVMLQNQDITFDAVAVITWANTTVAPYLCEVSRDTGKEETLYTGLVIEAGGAVLIVASSKPCGSESTQSVLI